MNQTSNAKPIVEIQAHAGTATLLFVDDESNILSSLKRLFHPLGYKILTAENGKQGLILMQQQSVDLVISDMRMPEMDGSEFLEHVAKHWPETVRILLTGYADMTSTISAVNKGKIYRYISKPWEDNDVVLTVQTALEQKNLRQERNRLQKLTKEQNEQLRTLNSSLEDKVAARTGELQQTVSFLELTQNSLQNSYHSTVELCASLIELRARHRAGHSRRISKQVMLIAAQFNMDPPSGQQLLYAALLRDIGKIGLADNIMHETQSAMNDDQRKAYMQHPVIGEGLLMSMAVLHEAAKLIRHQDECFDGSGFPDKLAGTKIPLGSRIIKVVADYEDLQEGLSNSTKLTALEAQNILLKQSGHYYDPQVIDIFIKSLGRETKNVKVIPERRITSKSLKSGMKLSRDLVLKDRVLLLSQGHLIDKNIIQRIHQLEESMSHDLEIYIVSD